MTAHPSPGKPLPPPPLPPRNQPTMPVDDTKDPHFLPFLNPDQQDAGPSRQSTAGLAAPPYTPRPVTGYQPADEGTWSSMGSSDAPTVEELADIKRRSLINNGEREEGGEATTPEYTDDAVPSPELAAAADQAGASAAVEATATATDEGNIQVEIDVRNKSRFRDDLRAMGLDGGSGDKEKDGGWRKAWMGRRGSKKGNTIEADEDGAGPSSTPGTPKSARNSGDEHKLGGYMGHVPVMNIVIFIVGSRGM